MEWRFCFSKGLFAKKEQRNTIQDSKAKQEPR
jgi:hypothetical protein